ncbi:hypothetical protein HMI55_000730 [Coelomomyces lativittatus]|nr:hypothetical protein HMI55_000730 [Coelomomyces lativittatus]
MLAKLLHYCTHPERKLVSVMQNFILHVTLHDTQDAFLVQFLKEFDVLMQLTNEHMSISSLESSTSSSMAPSSKTSHAPTNSSSSVSTSSHLSSIPSSSSSMHGSTSAYLDKNNTGSSLHDANMYILDPKWDIRLEQLISAFAFLFHQLHLACPPAFLEAIFHRLPLKSISFPNPHLLQLIKNLGNGPMFCQAFTLQLVDHLKSTVHVPSIILDKTYEALYAMLPDPLPPDLLLPILTSVFQISETMYPAYLAMLKKLPYILL